MINRNPLAVVMLAVLAACTPKNEFEHQTVQAYQQDEALRVRVLTKCGEHITKKLAFATDEDTGECQKAASAQQDVNLAAWQQRQSASAHAAINAALGH